MNIDSWTASNGIQHIRLLVMERPMPSPRATGGMLRKSARGRAYTEWRGRMRDLLRASLDIEGWPTEWTVGAAWAFGATFAAPPNARRRQDGTLDGRTIKGVTDWDLTNLTKACEDVCKGFLWKDDKQVRFSGPGAAIDTEADWWAVHAWTGPPGTDLAWREAWQDRSVTETVKVERM